METSKRTTHGEDLVRDLLNRFPKTDYYFKQEARLNNQTKNSKPDFIVLAVNLGVIVIEVKDWVEITNATQHEFTVKRRDGVVDVHSNPYTIAENYAHDLERLFQTEPQLWTQYRGKKQRKFPWQPMVILPNIPQGIIQQLEAKHVITQNTFLGREALRSPITLEQALKNLPWKWKLKEQLTRDIREIVRGILDPSVIVENQSGQQVGPLTVVQENLVKEQVRLFMPEQSVLTASDARTNGSTNDVQVRLIRGVAGSGKTLILLKRVRWLRETYPNSEILLLAFNRQLVENFEKRLEGNCRVINFHRLCTAIIKDIWRDPLNKVKWLKENAQQKIEDLDLKSDAVKDELQSAIGHIGKGSDWKTDFVADELTWRLEEGLLTDNDYLAANRTGRGYRLDQSKRQTINDIFNHYTQMKHNQKRLGRDWFDWEDIPFLVEERLKQLDNPFRAKYDIILIDEAQDFTPSWMRVVLLLLKPGGFLSLCDDPTQGIFHNYNWKQKNIPVVGRTSILRTPFRSTYEISTAAHALIDADELLSKSDERPVPDFTSYSLTLGTLPELLICGNSDNEHKAITNRIANLLDEDVPANQIAVLCWDQSQISNWRDVAARKVYVNSFRKAKGLEFHSVFIPHLHSLFSLEDDVEVISKKRQKVFMAMTRARHTLYLSAELALPDALMPIQKLVDMNKVGLQ